MKRRTFLLATAGVGALAAAAGYGVHRWWDSVGLDGVNPAAVRALLAAPLRDLKGGSQTLQSWRGRVLVVNFWATWCAPCRVEIPEFVRLQGRYGPQGLQFVGIAFDQPQPVEDFAREFRINYPLLIGGLDTMALMRECGNRSGVLPYSVMLDRQGNIAGRHSGVLTQAKLVSVIGRLI